MLDVLFLEVTDGLCVLTAGVDCTLVLWSVPEFTPLTHIMGHHEDVVHVQFIPSLSWSDPQQETEGAHKELSVTADTFVCVVNDEMPRVVSKDGFGARLLKGHTANVIACDVSVDGQWIATGGKDQSLRVWNASTYRCVCVLTGHAGSVSAVSFPKKRPKGPNSVGGGGPPWCLATGSEDKTMKIWELPPLPQLESVSSTGATPIAIEKAKVTVIAGAKEVNDLTVAPNNKVVASGGQDKLIRIWRFPEADLLGECKGHRRGIWHVAFSPVDQVIASASGDQTVRLWNLKDFTTLRAFQGHGSAVLRVCFLANGMQLMSSGADGLLKLWHIRTAECAATFEEHDNRVWSIDMMGDQMISGGSDSKICFWRDATAEKSQERHNAEADTAVKTSQIGLLIHEGKIEEALTLALDLGRFGQMRSIITDHGLAVVQRNLSKTGAEPDDTPEVDLRRWVLSLDQDQLEKVVGLVEQWNTNRKTASIAQMLLHIVLSVVPVARMESIEGMNSVCAAVLSYSNRHMSRVESLLQKTYMIDLVLQTGHQGLALQDEPKAVKALDGDASLKRTMDVLMGDVDDVDDVDDADAVGKRMREGDEDEDELPSVQDETPATVKLAKSVVVRWESEDEAPVETPFASEANGPEMPVKPADGVAKGPSGKRRRKSATV